MAKKIFSKVVWVGRTAATVFGLALVMALLFGVTSTALCANGGSFILGKATNVATKVTGLVGKVAAGEALVVKNPSGGSALGLSVGDPLADPASKAVAPMKVDSQAKVGNLNADQLDGKDSSDFMTYNSTLKSGQTLAGVWGAATPGTTTNAEFAVDTIEFRPKLAAAIPRSNMHYVTSATSECPGQGQAASGHLCVYETWTHGLPFYGFYSVGSSAADEWGTALYFQADSSTSNARGTWAVTAP